MKKILLVAATENEIAPLLKSFNKPDKKNPFHSYRKKNIQCDALITGAGMVNTVFMLSLVLSPEKYDLVLNAGIAGSFRKEIAIGDVVNVLEEIFSDFGAEDGENFLSAFEINLLEKNQFPFRDGKLKSEISLPQFSKLKSVRGITVNTVHGNNKNISAVVKKFNPDIESMEGAAVAYCAMQFGIPWVEIRSISNRIERRDKSKWNIPLSIKNLNDELKNFIESIK